MSDKVTRFEVIDHREGGLGRVYSMMPCSIMLSYQDDGRTLKVFVSEPKGAEPRCKDCNHPESWHAGNVGRCYDDPKKKGLCTVNCQRFM